MTEKDVRLNTSDETCEANSKNMICFTLNQSVIAYFSTHKHMSCSQSNGIYVGNYLLLGRRLVNTREVNVDFKDYYAEYFKDLGLQRFDMMVLTPFLYTADPLSGLDILEPITPKNKAKN